MKRNCPPPSASEGGDFFNECELVNARIDELFAHSVEQIRKVSIGNKGIWLNEHKHVRVDSFKGLPNEFVSFSPEFKHYYLGPYEALYCLESSQLLIYYNSFPLSLAEAYQLLLNGPGDFKNYRVFQQLNRTGYICLRPVSSSNCGNKLDEIKESDAHIESTTKSQEFKLVSDLSFQNQHEDHDEVVEPLLQIETIEPLRKEVLSRLRELGPRDYELSTTKPPLNDNDLTINITFDLYKRETFATNKPRKGKQGNPDYYLIVCDKALQRPPSCRQLARFSNKLLFGLVDHDNSICFAQWW